MNFQSPWLLLTLLLVPLLALAAYYARARQRRYALRYPAAPTLLAAMEGTATWQRFIAPVLALLAVAALAFAVARPERKVRIPIEQASIVLVTDHSGSMQAEDVDPTRLSAAQKAARRFISKLPSSVRLGAVAFSDSPDAVQTPTTDHDATRKIIDGQVANGATATGDALTSALSILQPKAGQKQPPSAIVLLSDGATTTGSDPVQVAAQAKRRKIPIYTVALGEPGATIPNPNPVGPPLSVSPDPETLRTIARNTGGVAYSADDESSLNQIYDRLGSQLGTKSGRREITVWFAGAGFLLLLGAGVASVKTSGRLP